MKFLLLSCSTGEGHNHCARAVADALEAIGAKTEFLDMLNMFGDPGPLSFDKLLNRISTKTPEVFGMMYHAGSMFSSTGVTSPVYLANIRHARQLNDFIRQNAYDAVICSHLFPMETLTYLRKHGMHGVRCYGVLSDYTCIPFLAETELDGYFLPHGDVKAECVRAGMPEKKLIVTGMPVSRAFSCGNLSKQEARAELGLPADKKIYMIMTGGIGCGDAVSLCDCLRRVPDKNTLLCVLPGKNEQLRAALEAGYSDGVEVVPFTDKVALYMRAADVLLSKAGGISSSEAAVLGVPLVHTMVIPGVETLNAEFFMSHGMSFFAENIFEAARFADRLVFDRKAADRMLSAQKECVPQRGAELIAKTVTEESV